MWNRGFFFPEEINIMLFHFKPNFFFSKDNIVNGSNKVTDFIKIFLIEFFSIKNLKF